MHGLLLVRNGSALYKNLVYDRDQLPRLLLRVLLIGSIAQESCKTVDECGYRSWVASLPQLTQAQLSDVLSRVKVLSLTTEAPVRKGKREFGQRVLKEIVDFFRKEGVDCPTVHQLQKSQAYVQSRDKFGSLAEFLEQVSKQRLVQDAILGQAIALLYHDLLQWGVAVSAHTLLRQIHRLPATLNRHFPGYVQSGLLTKIVKVI